MPLCWPAAERSSVCPDVELGMPVRELPLPPSVTRNMYMPLPEVPRPPEALVWPAPAAWPVDDVAPCVPDMVEPEPPAAPVLPVLPADPVLPAPLLLDPVPAVEPLLPALPVLPVLPVAPLVPWLPPPCEFAAAVPAEVPLMLPPDCRQPWTVIFWPDCAELLEVPCCWAKADMLAATTNVVAHWNVRFMALSSVLPSC